MKFKKILLTGAAGFIGSHVYDLFSEKYFESEITILDKMTYAADIRNIPQIITNNKHKLIVGDLTDMDICLEATKEMDLVINLAAESHVDNSFNNSIIFSKSNTLGTHTLMEACKRNKVDRIIHVSTDEVYGENMGDPFDSDSGFYGYDDDHFSAYGTDGLYFDAVQQIEYTFDGRSLTVPTQELTDFQDSTLTIGGTLSYSMIDVPANIPTKIMGYDGDISSDYGSWEIHIKEDGSWVEVFRFEEPQDQDGWTNVFVDSTVAEWEMKDDQIVVTYKYDDFWPDAGGGPGIGQGTWIYQVAYTYEVINGNLKLLNEFNMCGDEFERFCLEMLETEYQLDRGSLEEIKMVWELEFTKTPNLRKMRLYSEPMRKALARHPLYKIQK